MTPTFQIVDILHATGTLTVQWRSAPGELARSVDGATRARIEQQCVTLVDAEQLVALSGDPAQLAAAKRQVATAQRQLGEVLYSLLQRTRRRLITSCPGRKVGRVSQRTARCCVGSAISRRVTRWSEEVLAMSEAEAGQHVKILFDLEQDEDGYPPASAETLWAVQVGEGLFKIDNVPIFVQEGELPRGETRLFSTSMDSQRLSAEQMLALVRLHWGIENGPTSRTLEQSCPSGSRMLDRNACFDKL